MPQKLTTQTISTSGKIGIETVYFEEIDQNKFEVGL